MKNKCSDVLAINRVTSRLPSPEYIKTLQSDLCTKLNLVVCHHGSGEWPIEPDEEILLEDFMRRGGFVCNISDEVLIIGEAEDYAWKYCKKRFEPVRTYGILEDDVYVDSHDIAYLYDMMMHCPSIGHCGPYGFWDKRNHEEIRDSRWRLAIGWKPLGFCWLRIYSTRCLDKIGKQPFDSRIMMSIDRDMMLKVVKAGFAVAGADIKVQSKMSYLETRKKLSTNDRFNLLVQSRDAMKENHPESADRIDKWFKSLAKQKYGTGEIENENCVH